MIISTLNPCKGVIRLRGYEKEAENILRRAARVIPDNADVFHALGLSLVRQKRGNEAVEQLRLAAILNPNNVHYVYVYAVALNSTGNPQQAFIVLQGATSYIPIMLIF